MGEPSRVNLIHGGGDGPGRQRRIQPLQRSAQPPKRRHFPARLTTKRTVRTETSSNADTVVQLSSANIRWRAA
jgi:hypothetical protein